MNSSEGFQTKIWGAPLWLCLHMISLNYTPDKHKGYKSFFESLQYVLPCKACRDNYSNILQNKLPLSDSVFKSRESMAFWVFKLHNQVQRDIYNRTQLEHDKPMYKDTYTDFYKAIGIYDNFRAKCTKNSHGCVVPVKGSRRRTKITIARFAKPRKGPAIIVN